MKLPNLKNNLNLILGFIAAAMISLTLRDLIGGSFQLRTAVFLGLAVAIGIYFLLKNLRSVSDILRRRWIRYALNFFLLTVIMLGIIVFIYLLALNNDVQIDVTANARYSLSDQTIKVLKNLKEDVTVYGFYGTYQKRYTLGRQQMDDLLEQFTLYGGKFGYKYFIGYGAAWVAYVSGLAHAAPVAYTCLRCARCVERCPVKIDTGSIISRLRTLLVKGYDQFEKP